MSNINEVARSWFSTYEPPERLTVSEWADRYRYLSPESSSQPGRYITAKTPYAREWMDVAKASDVTSVALMVASQLGKTEILNNVVGYHVDIDPSTVLVVQPTVELAEAWSKERFAPMVRDTPRLYALVSESKSRDVNNTILRKVYPGGNIVVTGANAPSGLASRPRRVVLLDEVDRFPASAGTEGDPCTLAIKRTENYHDPVIYMTSTPTVKNASRIEAEYEASDKRRWYCPCPKCGHYQTLKWANVRYEAPDGIDAHMVCEGCNEKLEDADRISMVRKGEWRAEAPGCLRRGYHLNGLASLFRHKRGYKNRLHQMVADHLAAKRLGVETLKAWVNTFLAETWEEGGESMSHEFLMDRREDWGDELPAPVRILTCGVDIQGDRIEAEVVGWGEGEESWSLDHFVLIGDFNRPELQQELENYLSKKWVHPVGIELGISCTFIDSGHKTKAVYAFTKKLESRRVYAIKGVGGVGLPVVGRPGKRGVERALLFPIGVDTVKEVIYSRLKIGTKGNGFMHFPSDRSEDWFRQLVVEKRVTRYKNGVPYVKFENISRARNEALDMRVYATAALALLRPNWEKLNAAFVEKEEKEGEEGEVEEVRPKREYRLGRKGGGWVNNY